MNLDRNVEAVMKLMLERSYTGLRKYGTNTERTDIDLNGWIQHLLEELCDAAIYCKRIQSELTERESGNPGDKPGCAENTTPVPPKLLADVIQCYRMLMSEPDSKGALFKAENILREAIIDAGGKP